MFWWHFPTISVPILPEIVFFSNGICSLYKVLRSASSQNLEYQDPKK